MRYYFKNNLVLGIILLLFGGSLLPSIQGNIKINIDIIQISQQKSNVQVQSYLIPSVIPFPKNLEEGDLLFFDIKPFLRGFIYSISGFSNDHVIMYIGLDNNGRNWFVESCDYSFFDLNISKNGVQKTTWGIFLLYADFSTITIGKVHASKDQKFQAMNFALSVVGDHYQYSGRKCWKFESWHANPVLTDPDNPFYEKYFYPDDPYFNQWICVELVWAAYLHQGIELDSTAYAIPDLDYHNRTFFKVVCDDILNSENITMVSPLWN